MEQLREEIVGVRDVGVPRPQEDGKLAVIDHLRERSPVRVVVDLGRDADRRERLLDLLVLEDDVVPLHARPDREGRQAASTRIARPRQQIAGLLRVVRVPGELRIEAERARRQNPAGHRVLTEVDVLDDRLAVDGVKKGLAHPPVAERLHPRVEAVEAHAAHGPLHVDVAVAGAESPSIGVRRQRRVLQTAPQELLVHRVALVAREDPEDETRELRRPFEVLDVRGQHDLLSALPAEEPERSAADRLGAEGLALSLDHVPRNDLGVADGEDRDERGQRLVESDLDGMPVERHESGYRPGDAFSELPGPPDAEEQVGRAGTRLGIDETGERVHDVVRGDLAPVVELRALAKLERPREPVPGRAPELGQRRLDGQRLVELHQAVEDLLRHRPAVDVADPSRIERLGVVPQRAPVDGAGARVILLLSRRRQCAGTQKYAQEDAEEKGGRTAPQFPQETG